MKVPKGNEMKRYVILFCVVLIFIVLSTVLAGYVSIMNIPNEVDQKLKEMSQWELLKSLPSNLTEMRTAFQLGNFFLMAISTYCLQKKLITQFNIYEYTYFCGIKVLKHIYFQSSF